MLRKVATFQILGVLSPQAMMVLTAARKNAHRAEFDFTPRYGFLYVRSRMISSRCNDNFDEFPAEEIKKAFLSFIGKPVFVNHHNDDHHDMRGVIVDAALHEDHNPDGSPDTWVEGLMEVDALRFPKLAKALILGHIERTSMGVDVQWSECSKCGNRASTPLEYCRHIPGMKGKRAYSFSATGARKSELIREKCYGLGFFENSLLVEPPADPTAYTLGKPVLGPGLEHLASRMATRRTAQHQVEKLMMGCAKVGDLSNEDLFDTDMEMARRATMLGRPGEVSKLHQQVRKEFNSRTASLVVGTGCRDCGSINTVALRGVQECLDCEAIQRPGEIHEAASNPRYPNPADHPWFQTNPVHAGNIVQHWDAGTDNEHAQGMRWYADAHHIAHSIAGSYHELHPHPQGQSHLGAGIVANYSPQQGWAGNMHNAARVLVEGKGIGGPGSGMFASNQQRTAADRILHGEHYNDALAGPKIQDFAHLIEHGGDKDPTQSHVVVDRHALSVATGRRMSTEDYNTFPKSTRHYYGHVVQTYRDAAQQIGAKEGHPVAGHQVQAATWLTRQRLNQAEERATHGQDDNTDRLNKGREHARSNAEQGWQDFREQHFPHITKEEPGTGYVAGRRPRIVVGYGETKAPADVDTLRDEACPVCGEENAYDGNECQVCGFQAPPKQFQDPNLDLAAQVDLRKDNADLDGTDVSDLNDDINDRDKDGLDDETGAPIGEQNDGDVQPALTCSNCGTAFEAGEPTTTDTRDPQVGDSGSGPDAGDVCPVCGKGVLETGTELAEADPDDDADRSEGPPEESSAQEPAPQGGQGIEDEDDPESENNDAFHGPPSDNGDDDEDDDQDGPPAKKKPNPFKR
jgi:hypothetical protein